MTRAAFAIPGDIDLPTGGYAYARRVLALLPECGIEVRHLVLPGSFPAPTAPDLAETGRLLAGVAAPEVVLADGLAYGALPAGLIARVSAPIVALVHHPLCLEAGLGDARQRELRELEQAALALARRVVTTSHTTARTLIADFAVPASRIAVAEPGTDPASRAPADGRPLRLLAVGSVVPRKAYDVLMRALAPLGAHDWRLTIAGATDRSAEALAALHTAIGESGLGARIDLVGPMSEAALAGHYASADIFVLPSLYEGYGMAMAEAMARGLPIVCTTGGAAADTAPDTAALKVPPGDAAALRTALLSLLEDAALRRRLADGSWAAGQALPRWEDTARIIAEVLEEVAR